MNWRFRYFVRTGPRTVQEITPMSVEFDVPHGGLIADFGLIDRFGNREPQYLGRGAWIALAAKVEDTDGSEESRDGARPTPERQAEA